MAYNSAIPIASDRLKDSQPQILANFAALAPWGAGYGAFLLQASAPSFAAGVDGIYTLLYDTSVQPTNPTNKNELFVHKQNSSGTSDIPFTASIRSTAAANSCQKGWTYLPSGLLMKWGFAGFTSGTNVDINPTTISGGPPFTAAIHVMLTKKCTLASLNAGFDIALNGIKASPSTTGEFNVFGKNTGSGCVVNYIVIGF